MTYRPAFDCLWCGTAWTTRGPADLEGWAQLCPTCAGKAGSNPFLGGRLRGALADRAAAGQAGAGGHPRADHAGAAPGRPVAQPAFPDDWFLRRGGFERGAIHDAAWAAELDVVTRWLDALGLGGRILEPAAGVGFFSPLLAERGELLASDRDGDALDLARERLVAHRLRAHLHVADPWEPSDGDGPGGAAATPASGADAAADALVAAFLLGRVRGAGLDNAIATLRGRLRTRGRLALVELRPDPAGGPPPGIPWTYHDPGVVEAALLRAGFGDVRLAGTGRFFLTASAVAG